MNSRRQPQRIPPPIDYGSETLEAASILEELPGDFALLLWKSLRGVRLWCRLSPEDRGKAFSADAYERRSALLRAAQLEPALLPDLEMTASLLRGETPEPADLAGACRRIAEWAQREGALGTALEYMQAASYADPSDPALAREVGMLARQRCEFGRAETWFRRAILVARTSRDWPVFALAYVGLSKVHLLRGNYPAARRSALRALRAAKRRSLRELAGMAYHDLAVISSRTDRASDVARFARAALAAYGPGHAWLPAVAHDVAVFWMKRGYFREALGVFEEIPATFGTPPDRLLRIAAVTRSAGAVGDRDVYSRALRSAARLLHDPAAAQAWANALVNMARGAESLGELERAREFAERARQLAVERGEAELVFAAEAVLESARGTRDATVPSDAATRAPRQVTLLASDLAAALLPA